MRAALWGQMLAGFCADDQVLYIRRRWLDSQAVVRPEFFEELIPVEAITPDGYLDRPLVPSSIKNRTLHARFQDAAQIVDRTIYMERIQRDSVLFAFVLTFAA